MSRLSPTAEGFRAAFRRPSFSIAEITWRWVVGATATALLLFGFFEFLNTLPITNGEILFLRSRQPVLISQAISRILRGGFYRGVLSLMLAVLLLSLLWMITASLGRVVTLRAILDHVREQIAQKAAAFGVPWTEEQGAPSATSSSPFHALIRLNFLRLSLVVAGLLGFFGASIIAGYATSDADPRPGLAFLLFLPLAVLITLSWFSLNWLLSLAALFAVRDDDDALGALSSAVKLCRQRTGALFAVSTWTGLAHLVAFVGATSVVAMPLALAGFVPWRLVLLAIVLMTLAYFALSDWIYTARLAGYVVIVEMPEALWVPALPPMPSQPPPDVRTSIDKDELILSDLPNLATEG